VTKLKIPLVQIIAVISKRPPSSGTDGPTSGQNPCAEPNVTRYPIATLLPAREEQIAGHVSSCVLYKVLARLSCRKITIEQ
ncbi:hypothetical protein JMJ78_0001052, partial [Colletotrichum scovillei]